MYQAYCKNRIAANDNGFSWARQLLWKKADEIAAKGFPRNNVWNLMDVFSRNAAQREFVKRYMERLIKE